MANRLNALAAKLRRKEMGWRNGVEGKTMEEAMALKPTADFDAKWGDGPIRPDQIVEEVYADLKRKVR